MNDDDSMNNAHKPAFPEPYLNDPNSVLSTQPGLTKREYFAAMALQGLMAVNDKGSFENKEEMIAEGVNRAIMAADELLKQLENGAKI